MFRWWLNSYSFVVYSPNRATVSFHQTFSIFPSSQQLRNRQCRRRLTISWNQFINLKDIIDVITNGNDLSTTSAWNLENGLWLLLQRRNRHNCIVRLQVNHSQYFPPPPSLHNSQRSSSSSSSLLFFDFEPRAWMRYKNRVQQQIMNTHRYFTTTTTAAAASGQHNDDERRRCRRRRRCNCEEYRRSERHVRRRSSINNRSREVGARIDNESGNDLQTVSRATANVTRLPSILVPQYSNISLWQNSSHGPTFSFRRTLHDHLRAASSSSTSPSPQQQQQQCDGGETGADNTDDTSNNSELAEYSALCSLNYACEIE